MDVSDDCDAAGGDDAVMTREVITLGKSPHLALLVICVII